MPNPNQPQNRIVTAELTPDLYEALEQYRRAREKEQHRFVSRREVVGAAIAALVGAGTVTE